MTLHVLQYTVWTEITMGKKLDEIHTQPPNSILLLRNMDGTYRSIHVNNMMYVWMNI